MHPKPHEDTSKAINAFNKLHMTYDSKRTLFAIPWLSSSYLILTMVSITWKYYEYYEQFNVHNLIKQKGTKIHAPSLLREI